MYKFFSFIEKVSDIFLLNMLWLICCIPVVTAGASTTALFYMTFRYLRKEETYLARGFFKAFKRNYFEATKIWLGILFSAGLFYLVIKGLGQRNDLIGMLAISVILFLILIYIMAGIYIFPLLARFENTALGTVKNAVIISFKELYETVRILLLLAIMAVIMWMYPVLLIVPLLFGGSGIALAMSVAINRIFDKYGTTANGEKEKTN